MTDPELKFDICALNSIVIYHKIEPANEHCLWPHLQKYHNNCEEARDKWTLQVAKCDSALWRRVLKLYL